MTTTRVVVIDDHKLLREAVTALVESEPGLEVVGVAHDVTSGAALVAACSPDVVLLDISLPGGGALDFAARLRGTALVIIVSMHERPEIVRAAFAAGAVGYVFKGSTYTYLIDAIRRVTSGGRYVDERVADSVADLISDAPDLVRLSERETSVLIELARGIPYKNIAERLGITARTVETYRRRVVEKLGLRTRADFLHYAVELGLIKPDDPAP